MTTKPSNPKDLIGSDKLPLHLWPATATAAGSVGLLNGALKYGRTNWRAAGAKASICVDAAKRHLDAWIEGEDVDADDGVPHLSAALANIAIIVDAEAAGMLEDDRMMRGGYRELVGSLTPHVARLKALHSDKSPHHYTIADNDAARRRLGLPTDQSDPWANYPWPEWARFRLVDSNGCGFYLEIEPEIIDDDKIIVYAGKAEQAFNLGIRINDWQSTLEARQC